MAILLVATVLGGLHCASALPAKKVPKLGGWVSNPSECLLQDRQEAVAGASRAKKEELTLAVGMTLIFTVLMMIFMPMFVHAVGMSDVIGGAWIGGTIDSTGAVVAAGAFLGPRAETVAAVVKMIQNILIGVVGFCVALFWVTSIDRDPGGSRPGPGEIWVRFPKFIVGFVGASLLFSFVLSPLFGSLFDGDGLELVEKGVIKAVTNPPDAI